eukprot:442397-Rhodomonas_salina.2
MSARPVLCGLCRELCPPSPPPPTPRSPSPACRGLSSSGAVPEVSECVCAKSMPCVGAAISVTHS